tara:strand:- start:201 stop:659 length:459 start_codon:yes stop_codon:yes gene_type:complete
MTNLTEKIINSLDSLDEQFKKYFIEQVLNKIKIDIQFKIEERKYKEKLQFIEENCEIISEIRNEHLLSNHIGVTLPSYCFWNCYDIIDEFKKKREYPKEIDWLYLYKIINIPHYIGFDNINYNPEIFDNGYNEYYNYDTESSEYEEDGYDSY